MVEKRKSVNNLKWLKNRKMLAKYEKKNLIERERMEKLLKLVDGNDWEGENRWNKWNHKRSCDENDSDKGKRDELELKKKKKRISSERWKQSLGEKEEITENEKK